MNETFLLLLPKVCLWDVGGYVNIEGGGKNEIL